MYGGLPSGAGLRDDALASEALVPEMLGEQFQRGHMVDRNREETLDLAGVKVHGQDPIDA